jgi:hypothetical protein
VRAIVLGSAAGFKFARPNWNPDGGVLFSDIVIS